MEKEQSEEKQVNDESLEKIYQALIKEDKGPEKVVRLMEGAVSKALIKYAHLSFLIALTEKMGDTDQRVFLGNLGAEGTSKLARDIVSELLAELEKKTVRIV